MALATDAQKWKIAGMVRGMELDANERSKHGKAIKAAARGFTFYTIRPGLT